MKRTIWTMLVVVLSCLVTFGQEEYEPRDLIILKSNYRIKGEVLGLTEDGFYRIQRKGGIVNIPQDQIKRIIQAKRREMSQPHYGTYITADLGINFNTIGRDRGGLVGYQAMITMGVQKSQFWGFGAGIGTVVYHGARGEQLFPVFAEYRCFLKKSALGPIFELKGGYGVGFKDLDIDIQKSEGGFFLHPKIGWMMSQNRDVTAQFSIGVIIQDAEYVMGSLREPSFIDITYYRGVVGLSLNF